MVRIVNSMEIPSSILDPGKPKTVVIVIELSPSLPTLAVIVTGVFLFFYITFKNKVLWHSGYTIKNPAVSAMQR